MAKSKKMKYRTIADFSKGPVWNKTLKPELEDMKKDLSNSDNDTDTIESAALRDVRRSTTNKVINKIIRLVERAESKIK